MEPQKRVQPAMANDLIKEYKDRFLTSVKKNTYGKNIVEIEVDNYADANSTVLHLLEAIKYIGFGGDNSDHQLFTIGRLAELGGNILQATFEISELADEINDFGTSPTKKTTTDENKA